MKRFVSIVLVAVLLAISLPLGAFAVVAETPEIVSQPTLADPTFVVSPDTDVTYQWYASSPAFVTNENATPMTKDLFASLVGESTSFNCITEEATYNPENASWSPMIMTIEMAMAMTAETAKVAVEPDSSYVMIPVYVTVNVGDMLFVHISGIEDASVSSYDDLNENFVEATEIGEDVFIISYSESGSYTVDIITSVAPVNPQITIVTQLPQSVAIEGETSATLSCDMESNVYYYCDATFADETILTSDYVGKVYSVTKQPDTSDPSVEVSFPEEVESYQWYTFEPGTDVAITDKNAAEVDALSLLAETGQSIPVDVFNTFASPSVYDSNNDSWIPAFYTIDGSSMAYFLYFAVELEAGDEIVVAFKNENISLSMIGLANISLAVLADSVENEDGSYTFTAVESGAYAFVVSVEVDSLDAYTSVAKIITDFAVSAGGDVDAAVAIEGENEAKLSDMTIGERYYCEITYEDGTVISSNVFKAEYAITQQPTGAVPTVEVNFPDDVESYQWFKGTDSDYGYVTPFDADIIDYEGIVELWGPPPSDIMFVNDISSYYYKTGIWSPLWYTDTTNSMGYGVFFSISLEAGESITVELVNAGENPDGELVLTSFGSIPPLTAVLNDDGTYTITAEEAGEYLLEYWDENSLIPENLGAKVYKNNVTAYEPIEGETKKTLSEKEVGETYCCVITFVDGTVLVSESFTVTEEDMLLIGDVNRDGEVDKKDYSLLKRYCFGTVEFDAEQLYVADINGDGEADKKDYGLLKRHCFGTYVIG